MIHRELIFDDFTRLYLRSAAQGHANEGLGLGSGDRRLVDRKRPSRIALVGREGTTNSGAKGEREGL